LKNIFIKIKLYLQKLEKQNNSNVPDNNIELESLRSRLSEYESKEMLADELKSQVEDLQSQIQSKEEQISQLEMENSILQNENQYNLEVISEIKTLFFKKKSLMINYL
jgi:hypothetical protein